MEWVDYLSKITHTASGQFIIGFLILVLGPPALFSEKTIREKFGIFGLIARSFRERKERAADLEEEILNRELLTSKAELHRCQERIENLEQSGEEQHQYNLYTASCIRELEIWATRQGLELPTSEIFTFTEWKERLQKED